MMNSLIEKIESNKQDMEVDLRKVPAPNRSGHELKRAQARNAHPKLVNEYKTEVAKTVIKAFLAGTDAKAAQTFSSELKKEKVFSVVVESVYESITAAIRSSLGRGGAYSAKAYSELILVCRTIGGLYNMFPPKQIKPVGINTAFKTDADLVGFIKERVRETYGDGLNREYIHDQVFKYALDNKFVDDKLLVLIPNLSSDERKTLYDTLFPGQPSFNVDLEGEEASRSHAMKLMFKINTLFKETTKKANEKTNGN